MKKLVIPFILMSMILSGCPQSTSIGIIGGADGPTSVIVSKKPRETDRDDGVTLYAKDVTSKGLTLVFEHYDDEIENEDFQTGEWYKIEKENDGYWSKVKPKQEDAIFNSIAYIIEKNDITEIPLTWEFLYGELPKGNYRVVKEVIKVEHPGDYEKEILYAYFSIQ